MKELVLSDKERRLIIDCCLVVFRLNLEGFLSDHFSSEDLHDLCMKVDGVNLDLYNFFRFGHGN